MRAKMNSSRIFSCMYRFCAGGYFLVLAGEEKDDEESEAHGTGYWSDSVELGRRTGGGRRGLRWAKTRVVLSDTCVSKHAL